MMFPRFFFALCAVFLFVAVGGIHAEVQSETIELSDFDLEVLNNHIAQQNGVDVDSSVEERNPAVRPFKFISILEILQT